LLDITKVEERISDDATKIKKLKGITSILIVKKDRK
jgi:hypothetical protein